MCDAPLLPGSPGVADARSWRVAVAGRRENWHPVCPYSHDATDRTLCGGRFVNISLTWVRAWWTGCGGPIVSRENDASRETLGLPQKACPLNPVSSRH